MNKSITVNGIMSVCQEFNLLPKLNKEVLEFILPTIVKQSKNKTILEIAKIFVEAERYYKNVYLKCNKTRLRRVRVYYTLKVTKPLFPDLEPLNKLTKIGNEYFVNRVLMDKRNMPDDAIISDVKNSTTPTKRRKYYECCPNCNYDLQGNNK
jgi:hypothetical protein